MSLTEEQMTPNRSLSRLEIIALITKLVEGLDKNDGDYAPYQICPKCNGHGMLVPDVNGFSITTARTQICDLCGGGKIIPMHKIQ